MSRFFIDRPIFAWVIAIIIMLAGALSITSLPIAQYPDARAAGHQRHHDLPRRLGQDARGHRHAGHRATAQRHRQPALHRRRTSTLDGTRDDHADLRARHRSGHRAGAGAEQGRSSPRRCCRRKCSSRACASPSRRATSSSSSASISDDGSMSSTDIADYVPPTCSGSAQPTAGRGRRPGLRHAVRHAHLARPGQAQQLRARPPRRGHGDPRAERAGRRRAARRPAGDAGPAAQRHDHRRRRRLHTPEQFGNILLRVNPDGSQVRLRDVARVELGAKATSSTRGTTASRRPASRSGSPPARTRSKPWPR